jgi:hypothetical protein
MLAALGLLLATTVADRPADLPRPRLNLQVKVERGVNLTTNDLNAIVADVTRIWAPVVDVVFSTSGTVRLAAVDTLHVAITNRRLPATAHTGLAWIDFVNGEPQRDITVSVAAATTLRDAGTWWGKPFASLPPRASAVFLQRAVARALAHEVGHYLLRSSAHTGSGLMRASFTVDEIMDSRSAFERIDAESVAHLRQQGLVARVDAATN